MAEGAGTVYPRVRMDDGWAGRSVATITRELAQRGERGGGRCVADTEEQVVRVCVLDDDAVVRKGLRQELRHLGHEVFETDSPWEALSTLEQGNARVLVCDRDMPEMSGPEVCRRVRALHHLEYVYILMLTSSQDDGARIEALEAGADDFATKPVDAAELRVRLHAAKRVTALESRDVTIFALAKLADCRDPETGAHLERVREYCRVLAAHLHRTGSHAGQVDEEFVRLIELTSPLHDIGKVAIPDCVLLKADRLTDAEYEVMKSHTILGACTLGSALTQNPGLSYLRMARDIALTHHERWDGKGYPRGLAGESIPLAGRIMAVADVYDALRSKRVYKGAFTHLVARGILVEGAGLQFDPALVEAFLGCEHDFDDIAQTFTGDPGLAAA